MAPKYLPGDAVGPYGIILLERLPRREGERDPRMRFQCPQCGESFVAQLCAVSTGRKKVCNKCSDQRLFFEGERYGPQDTLLLKLVPGGTKDVWQCSFCGKEFTASRYDIKQGHTRSCGCYRAKCSSERNRSNLVGQKFGRLTVIELAEDKVEEEKRRNPGQGTKLIWKCVCDCGTTDVYVPTNRLTCGITQSCGCLQRERAREANFLDLAGQKFGKLTAIQRCDKQDDGYYIWECICECGETAYYSTNQLTSGAKRHCGCETACSLGESVVRDILDDYGLAYEPQWHRSDCVNPDTGSLLYFDFKLLKYDIFIEYDGRQHFQSRQSFGSSENQYGEIRHRDILKDEWCVRNGFKLIRIPYTYYGALIKNPDVLMEWICGESSPIMPEYDPLD